MQTSTRRSIRIGRAALASLLCAGALALGCGGGDSGADSADGAPEPSATQIAAAVLKSLLSNKVEARETDAEAAPAPPPPAAPPPSDWAATADAPETCVIPYSGPVTIIPVRSATAINRATSNRGGVPVVYETEDTAIWEDGRVMTTNMENVGTHLNAVGWSSNPMQIAGTGQRPGGSRKNLGFGSAISSFERGNLSSRKKLKRTRRRG